MVNLIVADIMTREPVTIAPDANLFDCAKKMINNKVGSLILVENKKLVGFISHHDIIWALMKKSKENLKKIKAIDISPKKIITIRPTATIEEVLKKIKRTKFERLPVNQEGELVGMLTLKDILSFRPEFYPELEELTKIKEESQKLERLKKVSKRVSEGICEECGNQDWLYRFNGMLVCESCMGSI